MLCKSCCLSAVLTVAFIGHAQDQQPAAPKVPSSESLDGSWLFDEAVLGKVHQLNRVWTSVLTIKGDTFSLSKFLNSEKELKGSFIFDA